MMLVDCVSVEWIEISVQQLKSCRGLELEVLRGDDIPKPINITVFFPKTEAIECKILRLVEIQN